MTTDNNNSKSNGMTSQEQAPINFISDRMRTLQVPDTQVNDAPHSTNYNSLTSSINHVNPSDNNVAPTQTASPPTSCQYIKDGIICFHELRLRAENHPAITEKMMYFRNYRAQIENTMDIGQEIEIPPTYFDLIAALVQDSDEVSVSVLADRINELLSPFMRKEQFASRFHTAIEKVIHQLAYKCIYGLIPDIFAKLLADQQHQHQHQQQQHTMPPKHLCISRWEVHNIDYFPSDMQHAVTARRHLRQMMTDSIIQYISALPEESQRNLLFRPLATTKKQRHSRQMTEQQHPQQQLQEMTQTIHVETEEEKEKRLKKEEEKRKKDEEKRQREEEKRRREEEKRKKEEEKRKKEQSQLRLTSLFAKQMSAAATATSTSTLSSSSSASIYTSTTMSSTEALQQEQQKRLLESSKPTLFPPFYIKENVKMANPYCLMNNDLPNTNATVCTTTQEDFKETILSSSFSNSTKNDLKKDFLSHLSSESKQKRGVINTQIDIRTLLLPGSADIMSIPNVRLILKMKLLQFDEDVRPAYYGTWTNKKSNIITHKQPLAKDAALFDYDADSEAEWEPEDDEGEDIHSADEQDDFEDSDMMDPEDTGWLVPEGYLSDSEGVNDEDEEEIENRKMKYQNGGHGISQRKSTRPTIQKIVLGPFFEGEEENHNTVEYEAFKVYETQLFIDIPREGYDPFYKEPSTSNATAVVSAIAGDMDNGQSTSATTNPSSKVEFTDVHKHALISVIIEKPTESIPNLIQEAKANSVLKDVSKRQLEMNIKNIAVKEKRGSDKKPSWYIKETTS